ncbi:zinc-dependent metalloprotease [Thalassotalea marina]|uniref:Periplasmic metalloprotease n=1 Tax=Thalassotalea marina TaxID=1673741 RepID=A0A919END9_9GAMM|nr:zinc-dependent metalloprotease [Thalassotalea marina]GHG04283.1 periplasmic metalloprotease [Thalassotalea marina]
MNSVKYVFLLLFCSIFSFSALADYGDFVKDMKKHQGFFNFYYDEDSGKVYLEIDKFNQDFLFQSAMPHGVGSNDIGLDRGQLGKTRLVKFERVGDKVLFRQLNPYYRAVSDNVLEQRAVNEAFATSIIWGFKVAKRDGQKVLIDYTPFLLSDIHGLAATLKNRKQGNFSVDSNRSAFYQPRSKAFPQNTELEAIVTFKGSGAGQYLRSVTPEPTAVTVQLHHSLIALPDDNYQPRTFHPYSGHWAHSYADYAAPIEQPLVKRVINRHRLQKKNPQAKVSEAVEPIVYYLDPGVPEPIKTALIDGALWWDQAFAAIGYKNAFQVKMLPADADPMDVRYNVIQWVHRATRGWSYGSSVVDPRTGEILKGHVTLGSLRVRQDYLIALGLTSPFSQENTDTSKMKAMALKRIEQLSAHEVGHTLGIAHNFSASVNNRASVMDYPHPLIKLTDGKIDLSDAYDSNIGIWDKHVVAYGYQDTTGQDEAAYLANVIKQAQEKGLQYMSDPDARPSSGADAHGHLWDNGANAVDELNRVLKVRQKALADFGLNSIPEGTPLSEIEPVLAPIYNFHRYQVEAAVKSIAGLNYSYQVKEIGVPSEMSVTSGAEQKRALSALLNTLSPQVLTLPQHIIDVIPPKAYGYYRDRESFASNTGLAFDPISAAEASAKHTLTLLLNSSRLARLAQQAANNETIPSVEALLSELSTNTLKQKPASGHQLLVQQRVNQQVVEHLLSLWHNKSLVSEVRAAVLAELEHMQDWFEDYSESKKYRELNAHFALLARQIEFSLEHREPAVPASKVKLPPGSPIGG